MKLTTEEIEKMKILKPGIYEIGDHKVQVNQAIQKKEIASFLKNLADIPIREKTSES